MNRRISDRLLGFSATAYPKQGMDSDRNIVFGSPIQLTKIWVTRSLAQAKGTAGKESADTMTLFYQPGSSKPDNFTFPLGMKIEYMGGEYFVQSVTPCPCPAGIHHYEVGLK